MSDSLMKLIYAVTCTQFGCVWICLLVKLSAAVYMGACRHGPGGGHLPPLEML